MKIIKADNERFFSSCLAAKMYVAKTCKNPFMISHGYRYIKMKVGSHKGQWKISLFT